MGLVLGVAVAAAPWVALDSTVRGLVDYYVDGLALDAIGFGPTENLDAAATELAAVSNVDRVEPIAFWGGTVNATQSGLPPATPSFEFHFVAATFDSVTDDLGIAWTAAPATGSVLLHESFQDEIGVGDTLVVESRTPIFDANYTVIGEEVRTANYSVGGFFTTPRPDRPFVTNAAFLALSDLDGFRSQLNLTSYGVLGFLYIWLDRAALLDPYDLAASQARLQRQLTLMDLAVGPHGFTTSYASSSRGPSLSDTPSVIGSATLGLRVLFLVFAIPTLGMAALLAKVGFEVGLTGRRRELAVLRARGLSVRGVRLHLLGEATVLAGIGAVMGIGLAIALSRLFSPGSVFGVAAVVAPAVVSIAPSTVGFGFLLAWLLALGVSRMPSKLVASEDLVLALKAFHPEEAAIDYRPSRDFLAAGVASAGFLLVLAWGAVKDSPLGILTFILGFSTALAAPVAPFLLTVSVARYLTRGTNRAYRLLARLFRRPLGDLHPLVDRNLARAPRRSSNTALIVTFVLGFVVAISTLVASSEAYREESVLESVPADVVADTLGSPIPGMFNASNQAALRAIPGVAAITAVIPRFSDRGEVVLFDAATYLRTVPWLEARHLDGVEPRDLMAALGRGDAFAANPAFREATGLQPGDVLTFHDLLGGNATVRLKAYVSNVPGLSLQYGDPTVPVSYLDLRAVTGMNVSRADSGRYLIDLAPGANVSAAVDAVGSLFGGRAYVVSLEEARAREAANPLAGAVFGYLRTQANLAVGILVVAIALLVYSASVDRRDELATLIARGIEPRAATRLLMAEGWVVSLLGVLVGTFGGLVTAVTFLALASNLTSAPIPVVVPLAVVLPLLAVLVGVWVAGFAGAFAIRRMDVPRVLKLRGG